MSNPLSNHHRKLFTAILSGFLLAIAACEKEEAIEPVIQPYVTTTDITGITDNTAIAGGTVTDEGDAPVTEREFCWSTSADPTIANNKITAGNGKGAFQSTLTGLDEFTTYYVRAYATNRAGTAYGSNVSFRTRQKSVDVTCETTITDAEGNTYKAVKIGSQCWMESNLKTMRYNNGSLITNLTEQSEWNTVTSGAWSYYKNSPDSSSYGLLYNWHAAASANICPKGWHVPTDEDIRRLIDFLGTGNAAALKSATGWPEGKTGTNSSGFNFFPAGSRFQSSGFINLGRAGFMWTSSAQPDNPLSGILYAITEASSGLTQAYQPQNTGACIRCVRNN